MNIVIDILCVLALVEIIGIWAFMAYVIWDSYH